ncbi:hypothetical protein Tco_1546872, partial [Tanacetum coccineum]
MPEKSWGIIRELPYYERKLKDPRDFTKAGHGNLFAQYVPSTSIAAYSELENQVQRLMEAHLAPMQPTQVNKITSSCEICSGPHDTQYCMENPKQAFVEYASSCTDEAGGKWYTFKPKQNNVGDTGYPLWKSHPNFRWRQPQNSQNNFSNSPNRFQPNGPNRSFNNNPQNVNSQSNLEGLVSNFMASQDARLSKFEADFKQQQSGMTNKIDTVLKAITDRMAGALPSDTVKNSKLNVNTATLVLSARSYPTEDPQCSTHIHGLINAITIHPKDDEGIEWLDAEEPLDLVDTSEESVYESLIKEMPKCSLNYDFRIKKGDPRNLNIPWEEFIRLGKDMHVFVANMSYIMDFTILENIETNIDLSLLMAFTDGIKEITFKTPYKDPKRSELSSEGHDLLSSRVILSEDDYDRGSRKPSDLEDGFYRDTIKLGPEYVTGMD